MFDLGDYDTAYKDIEMALKNKYPKNLGKIFFYITKKITSQCFLYFIVEYKLHLRKAG